MVIGAVVIALPPACRRAGGPWTALSHAALELYRGIGDQDPQWAAQARLVRLHPSLLAQQVATYAALERELAAAVAARLPGAAELTARLTASTFLATLRVAVQVWLDRPLGTALPDLVRRALDETGPPAGRA